MYDNHDNNINNMNFNSNNNNNYNNYNNYHNNYMNASTMMHHQHQSLMNDNQNSFEIINNQNINNLNLHEHRIHPDDDINISTISGHVTMDDATQHLHWILNDKEIADEMNSNNNSIDMDTVNTGIISNNSINNVINHNTSSNSNYNQQGINILQSISNISSEHMQLLNNSLNISDHMNNMTSTINNNHISITNHSINSINMNINHHHNLQQHSLLMNNSSNMNSYHNMMSLPATTTSITNSHNVQSHSNSSRYDQDDDLIGEARERLRKKPKVYYPWLELNRQSCYSEKQKDIISANELNGITKKYKNMRCTVCAAYNPLTPWATMRPRKHEMHSLAEHANSSHHIKAERVKYLVESLPESSSSSYHSDTTNIATSNTSINPSLVTGDGLVVDQQHHEQLLQGSAEHTGIGLQNKDSFQIAVEGDCIISQHQNHQMSNASHNEIYSDNSDDLLLHKQQRINQASAGFVDSNNSNSSFSVTASTHHNHNGIGEISSSSSSMNLLNDKLNKMIVFIAGNCNSSAGKPNPMGIIKTVSTRGQLRPTWLVTEGTSLVYSEKQLKLPPNKLVNLAKKYQSMMCSTCANYAPKKSGWGQMKLRKFEARLLAEHAISPGHREAEAQGMVDQLHNISVPQEQQSITSQEQIQTLPIINNVLSDDNNSNNNLHNNENYLNNNSDNNSVANSDENIVRSYDQSIPRVAVHMSSDPPSRLSTGIHNSSNNNNSNNSSNYSMQNHPSVLPPTRNTITAAILNTNHSSIGRLNNAGSENNVVPMNNSNSMSVLSNNAASLVYSMMGSSDDLPSITRPFTSYPPLPLIQQPQQRHSSLPILQHHFQSQNNDSTLNTLSSLNNRLSDYNLNTFPAAGAYMSDNISNSNDFHTSNDNSDLQRYSQRYGLLPTHSIFQGQHLMDLSTSSILNPSNTNADASVNQSTGGALSIMQLQQVGSNTEDDMQLLQRTSHITDSDTFNHSNDEIARYLSQISDDHHHHTDMEAL